MTATVAEMKIEQLRKELADAEAAQQVKKTIWSELREAEAAANEAKRLVQINKQLLAEAVAGLEAINREFIPQGMSGVRTQNDQKKQQAQQEIHRLTAERDKLAGELAQKEGAFNKVVEQIAAHPVYKPVREKQKWLVAEATKLASTIFTLSLSEIGSLLNKITSLADAENELLGNARGPLRSEGLPDVKPILARFLQEVTPTAILDVLSSTHAQVLHAVNKATELVARPVLL